MSAIIVVGARIVGLAVARSFVLVSDGVVDFGTEDDLARPQAGRNPGVIHSGLHYTRGSFKATSCVAAVAASMKESTQARGKAQEIIGSLVVGARPEQLSRLATFEERAATDAIALARGGYRWQDVSISDHLWSGASCPGLWRLSAKYAKTALGEVERSLSRRNFAASLSELLPGVEVTDLLPAKSGVHAQATGRDGSLVDDFHIQPSFRQVDVLNSPSLAAMCAFETTELIVDEARKVAA